MLSTWSDVHLVKQEEKMWIVLHLLLLLQSGACTSAYNFSSQTVEPGLNVSLKCPHGKVGTWNYIFWFRLVAGNSPEFLCSITFDKSGSVHRGSSNTGHRITATKEQGTVVLQIRQVEKSDTAIYHCLEVNSYLNNMTFLNGIFLQVTEPEPSVSVVSEVQPGPPVKLQCSVLSHSGNDICQDGHKVSWFRTGPESVHPSFVYAHDECKEIKDNSTQKCVHTFSKYVNSSDAGTYLCAVVTCGRIFMGNPIKVNNTQDSSSCDSNNYLFFVLSAFLVLNFLLSAFLIKKTGPQTLDETFSRVQQREEESLVYSMPTIITRKTGTARQTAEEFSTYTNVCLHDSILTAQN
ncbi:uncharacterized protein LOC133546084 isoform X2 [Nerophis ophidion]|uniref:uncharacterized protein LOC133546084 isoform X2 n=1 Tax=Nerophis ophidion TaxID=159077 RepID=UPI002AE0B28C|nr:uncharacterized protein LOC133546084 isoform X2 [Nerophis ophidion]